MHYQNWKKNKPPVILIPDVVIDASKLAKNPKNLEKKVNVFEQNQSINLDQTIPSFATMSVEQPPFAVTSAPQPSFAPKSTASSFAKTPAG